MAWRCLRAGYSVSINDMSFIDARKVKNVLWPQYTWLYSLLKSEGLIWPIWMILIKKCILGVTMHIVGECLVFPVMTWWNWCWH